MPLNDWLTQVEDGHFETELLNLRLTDGSGRKHAGQGRLSWDKDSGIQVEAFTDGAESIIERLSKATKPGQLIPEGEYLKLTCPYQ